MKIIVRTLENGERIPAAKVLEKRRTVQQKFLALGLQYTETEAILGSLNAMGEHISEPIYIIEPITEVSYV